MSIHTGSFGDCAWSVVIGPIAEKELAGFVAHIRKIGREGKPCTVLDIAHSVSLPNPLQREQIIQAVASIEQKHFVRGHAVVTNTAVARGVLQVVNWFVPPQFPERIFRSPGEALDWLSERTPHLDGDGLLSEIERSVQGFASLRW